MAEAIGYGAAFQNEDNAGAWEGAEAIEVTLEDVLAAVRESVKFAELTEEEFNVLEPLFLTEVRTIRRIEWEDVK